MGTKKETVIKDLAPELREAIHAFLKSGSTDDRCRGCDWRGTLRAFVSDDEIRFVYLCEDCTEKAAS